MMEIQFVWAWVQSRRALLTRSRREEPDRGDIVQTAIIVGLFAAAAITIIAILVSKATKAANNVKTQ